MKINFEIQDEVLKHICLLSDTASNFDLECLPDENGIYTVEIPNVVRIIEGGFSAKIPNIEEIIDSGDTNRINNIKLILGDNVEDIGPQAFFNCNIVEVLFNRKIKRISSYAFYNVDLEKIFFPEDCLLEYLGEKAFAYSNDSKKSIDIIKMPFNIKAIKDKAFSGTKINEIDFSKCKNLTKFDCGIFSKSKIGKIILPPNLKIIGSETFGSCDIRDICLHHNVKKILDKAFACSSLEKIEIPNSVKKIGRWSFYNCFNLKSVIFEDNSSISTIAEGAFSYCHNLSDFVLTFSENNSCKLSLGKDLFKQDKNLLKIEGFQTWPINKIPDSMFERANCSEIYGLPSSVYYIGNAAFLDSKASNIFNNTDKTIPTKIVSLGEFAFSGVNFENIEGITFNSHLRKIGAYCFTSCNLSHLKNLSLINNLIIENSVFSYNNFQHINLANKSLKFGKFVFANNNSLETIEFTGEQEFVPTGMFFFCKNIKSVSLSNSIKRINSQAFGNCSNIKEVLFSEKLEEISSSAFRHTRICKIDLSKTNVSTIKPYTFCNSYIEDAIFPHFITSIDKKSFINIDNDTINKLKQDYPFLEVKE